MRGACGAVAAGIAASSCCCNGAVLVLLGYTVKCCPCLGAAFVGNSAALGAGKIGAGRLS